MTVTGTYCPSASKMPVMPTFFPNSALIFLWLCGAKWYFALPIALDLNFYFYSRRQFELHQRIDGSAVRIQNVDEPLVRADLELLAALLIHVRRAVYREDGFLRRQRNRPGNDAARGLHRPDDLFRALVDQVMIVRFQFDSNLLHYNERSAHRLRMRASYNYFVILSTTPAPTVRPPSRIAKRSPSSMAIGLMSSIFIWTESPGITISTPSGKVATPVTSVVRK